MDGSRRGTRRGTARLLLTGLLAGAVVALTGPGAQAVTDEWAQWDPIEGESRAYTTTMRQQAPGFPAAAVSSDSRANVALPSSTFLGPGTPPGAKYGSSRNSRYLSLRPRQDNAQGASTTTYTFADPTPDTGWAFVLGDVDADQVQVTATGADGAPVPADDVDDWFQGSFNYAGGTDLPRWQPGTSTLVGNVAATDTDGASGWFEPDVRLSSLTLTFTRRAGFPVYQTWFVSRARPIGGTVQDVSAPGSGCPVTDAVLTLVSPYGDVLATTSPEADGSYSFGELATQDGYVVRLRVPEGCAVVGPAQDADVSNRGDDGDPASRADFELRAIVPQPIGGTVTDVDDDAPLAGVTLTLTAPDGTSRTTTTDQQGDYLFDDNPVGEGYELTVTPPAGFEARDPADGQIEDIAVDDDAVDEQDFVLGRVDLGSVAGEVTREPSGEPASGVDVVVERPGTGDPEVVVTDEDGAYLLDGLPPGNYVVRPEPAETGVLVDPVSRAVAITDAGEVRDGLDFALTAAPSPTPDPTPSPTPRPSTPPSADPSPSPGPSTDPSADPSAGPSTPGTPPSDPLLPATGGPALWWPLIGVGLVTGGASLVMRRRRPG